MKERFPFGKNWKEFMERYLTEERIGYAISSLKEFLELDSLKGLYFLDVGCGSGLFSLAAHRLGAERIVSFDIDPSCTRCCEKLKEKEGNPQGWEIMQGDILDESFVSKLPCADIVYAWGVLHHTGDMQKAIEMTAGLTKPKGYLWLAIYNDQGKTTRIWRLIKRTYCRLPHPLRYLILIPCAIQLWGPAIVRDFLRLKPFASWRDYAKKGRGMSAWNDIVDWVGGYPFEVAKPEDVFKKVHRMGFSLVNLKTCGGGKGCNEYLFVRLEDHTLETQKKDQKIINPL
jgi:2-polyprenyl-6-hydroxyphenyl methylase/3-demethylubiquinone-9 3-methyltransferase